MSDDQFRDWMLRQYQSRRITRRRFVGTLAASGIAVTAIEGLLARSALAQTPRQGGRIVVGMEAAQAQDSLDPTKYYSTSNFVMAFAVNEPLVNRDATLQAIPWLATAWEPNADGSAWVFDLRPGVIFHDGAAMTSADIAYSMTRHFRESSESPTKGFMSQIDSIDILGPLQVRFNLKAPNADFPLVLSDTRIHVTKDGLEDFSGRPPGTGPFKVVEFSPGSRYVVERNTNYWGEGPFLDEIEFVGIPDGTGRINAMLAGDIHVILELDQAATRVIENSGIGYVVNAPSGAFLNLAMMLDRAPTQDADVRLAIKHALDRKGMLANVFKGLGSMGNDHPIAPIDPYYNDAIPQRVYDPDKARFYIRKAGLENTPIDLYGSDVAGAGALACAQHLQQSAAEAGVNFNVINPPSDTFWNSVWIQQPIITSGWDARPNPDLIFSIAFARESVWNETKWDNDRFESLLLQARSQTDFAMRKEIYGEMQLMLHENGGHATLGFRNYVDAARNEVKGITPHGSGPLGFYQFHRMAWLDA